MRTHTGKFYNKVIEAQAQICIYVIIMLIQSIHKSDVLENAYHISIASKYNIIGGGIDTLLKRIGNRV
ncbi:MAG: hypothetical protein NWF08_02930 [Candidatus Bathyarchaeota archaeon]|nr:hypothetical protein [Candidatus Bathyarchaeota archaeon]